MWHASRSSSSRSVSRSSSSSGAKYSFSSFFVSSRSRAEVALAVGGDADDVAPPVLRVAPTGDQAALLERVEHRDEPARVDVQRVGDRRLGLGDALGQDREDAVVVVLEALLLEERDRLAS